jgi:hypothetical protein
MDFVSIVLSSLLFYAFVPNVLVRIPEGGSRATVLVTHAVLFSVVTSLVMTFYWRNIRGFTESMSNYGPTCPNGFIMDAEERCVPVGHATYDVSMTSKPSSPAK